MAKNMAALEAARDLNGRLKKLVGDARTAEAKVAAALLEMKRRGLFRCLGYSRIQDYAEAELDLRKSKTKDLIEIARRIESLPATREAFEKGDLSWTKARQIIRVAAPETEEHWLHKARTLSNRGLESEVARAKGEPPVERIVLELTPAEAADIDAAIRMLREQRGEAVPVGSAVAELCRLAMGPPVDRPGYQIVIHQCPTCEKASRDADRGPIEVSPEELQAAKEDAAILDLTAGGKGSFKHTITPAERRAVIARDRERCALCGSKLWLHIHHIVRKDGDPAVLGLLCDQCHQGLIHAGHVTVSGRAPEIEFRLADGSPAPAAGTRAPEPDWRIAANVSKNEPATAPARVEPELSEAAGRVLGTIAAGPLLVDEIIERLDLPASRVFAAVTEVEIARLARNAGGYVALIGS